MKKIFLISLMALGMVMIFSPKIPLLLSRTTTSGAMKTTCAVMRWATMPHVSPAMVVVIVVV